MKMKLKYTGLSLIEVLVAVAIIAILSAGLYAVGNYLDTKMKIERTKSTIHLLITALERYHDFYEQFPIYDNNDAPPGYYPADGKCIGIEKVYYRLSLAPESRKILEQIRSLNRRRKENRNPIRNLDGDDYFELYDPWGNELLYYYDTGDNFPELKSEGPKSGNQYRDDDISSKDL